LQQNHMMVHFIKHKNKKIAHLLTNVHIYCYILPIKFWLWARTDIQFHNDYLNFYLVGSIAYAMYVNWSPYSSVALWCPQARTQPSNNKWGHFPQILDLFSVWNLEFPTGNSNYSNFKIMIDDVTLWSELESTW